MFRWQVSLVAPALLLTASVVQAEPKSGPEVGTKVSPLKATVAVGDKKEETDLAKDRKDQPTVYCFVRADKFDRPLARFIKTLDTKLADEPAENGIVAVWLTEDADATKEYLPRAQQSIKLDRTTYAYFVGLAGPDGWGINSDVHLTVVVVKAGKVEAVWPFLSVNETDVPAVLEALKKK
jgi:hypothetical protein